jgi:Zn-dependent protease
MTNEATPWILFVLVVGLSIPLHEFARALAADMCGDDVPDLQNRVRMDPWIHWDIIGSALILVGVLLKLPVVGWGKPVETEASRYHNPRGGAIIVWLAGLLAYLLMVAVGAALYRYFHLSSGDPFLAALGSGFVMANLTLAVFNQLPIPPLDGAYLALGLLAPLSGTRYGRLLGAVGLLGVYVLMIVGHKDLDQLSHAASRLLLGSG